MDEQQEGAERFSLWTCFYCEMTLESTATGESLCYTDKAAH